MHTITVVGSIGFDDIKSPYGEVKNTLGGAAPYIALSASHFAKKVNIVSVVGHNFSQNHSSVFNRENIDFSGIKMDKNEKTFFWSGEYMQNMNVRKTHVTELNALEKFNPILPSDYQNTGLLMLGNLSPSIQLSVVKQLKKRPKLIMLDTMNYWIKDTLPELKMVLKEVDILTINDEEALMLSGEYNLIKAFEKIRAMGPDTLIIKQGENGAILFQEDSIFFSPALVLKDVIDPTGAGDTFAGGVIGYLAQSEHIDLKSIKKAILYGSVMASFCVQKFGLNGLLAINSKNIEKRINTLKDMVTL